jgi:hypothetical protein
MRDYIHVVDLAGGHVKALAWLATAAAGGGLEVFNLGTGRPSSVLEVVAAYQKASGKPIAYELGPRRPGDVARSFALPDKARAVLGWEATLGLTACARTRGGGSPRIRRATPSDRGGGTGGAFKSPAPYKTALPRCGVSGGVCGWWWRPIRRATQKARSDLAVEAGSVNARSAIKIALSRAPNAVAALVLINRARGALPRNSARPQRT